MANILQDENNYYRFTCGAVNEVPLNKPFGNAIQSQIQGSLVSFLETFVKRPYAPRELRHPFDVLHTFVMDRILKKEVRRLSLFL